VRLIDDGIAEADRRGNIIGHLTARRRQSGWPPDRKTCINQGRRTRHDRRELAAAYVR
jgi:hypothetical protein